MFPLRSHVPVFYGVTASNQDVLEGGSKVELPSRKEVRD